MHQSRDGNAMQNQAHESKENIFRTCSFSIQTLRLYATEETRHLTKNGMGHKPPRAQLQILACLLHAKLFPTALTGFPPHACPPRHMIQREKIFSGTLVQSSLFTVAFSETRLPSKGFGSANQTASFIHAMGNCYFKQRLDTQRGNKSTCRRSATRYQ